MNFWYFLILNTGLLFSVLSGAVVTDNDDVNAQGLYTTSDKVTILTDKNFDKKVYGQKNAFLVQFYNSYCGHCRAFAPKFKSLASEIEPWKKILKLAVLDCSVEENNEICRQFEVMAYPTLRYLHENYVKGNTNVGDKIQVQESHEKLKANLINKMQSEQSMGRLANAPQLSISSQASYPSAVGQTAPGTLYTFLVFENLNSTVGSELALDINDYEHIQVKRVYDNSELAETIGLRNLPGLAVVKSNMEPTLITPTNNNPSKADLLKAVNSFLKSQNYAFPIRSTDSEDPNYNLLNEKSATLSDDVVYYSDLEKTLKTSLHTEIIRHKILSDEPLQALLNYLDVLIVSFPFKNVNLQEYLLNLRTNLSLHNQWSGNDVYNLVKRLEIENAPVYTSDLEYIGCKGSQEKYRGYTCGLWTLFHTLTVNAVNKPGLEGAKVLKAMHGYIKHFFGCTECSEHFQAMAAKNKLFDVKENNKAVLWLWISHNEVNLRLAGDITEDPQHPKIQFPSVKKCKECRLARGAWNLPAVYEYLLQMYGASNIQTMKRIRSASTAPSPFSYLDIGMLSLLYILSFIMLILVIKYFISKHFFRKRRYKHALGKV